MIQTKDNNVIHAKGLNSKQLELILKEAINITAIDTEMNRHPIALQIEKADKAIVAEDFDALMDIYTNVAH